MTKSDSIEMVEMNEKKLIFFVAMLVTVVDPTCQTH
jgi:hypothetical protein